MKQMYNIVYERDDGSTDTYCMSWMDYTTALRMLDQFIQLYGNGVDDIRPYPNGKGTYNFTNARIVSRS